MNVSRDLPTIFGQKSLEESTLRNSLKELLLSYYTQKSLLSHKFARNGEQIQHFNHLLIPSQSDVMYA